MSGNKQSALCGLINNTFINNQIFRLDFEWPGEPPKAGQFFMIKPARTSVFLGRPISVAAWNSVSKIVSFLVAVRGKGTAEFAEMRAGETALLTGPLGNSWADFMPEAAGHANGKPVALAGGGIGVAPLEALYAEFPGYRFDFYAGFRTGFSGDDEKAGILGPAASPPVGSSLVIATEDGTEGVKGLIPGFIDPRKYSRVFACGPEPMLKKIAAQCGAAGVPCFVSLERYMACGAGACLGCTVKTINGNRRCCADGPIFPAEELIFDE
ncbi:MAG TPA: dihydroorotate dehydrogenase [Treponema sp.]|nr:dihydroorotate dehydrogenase [Treponema sp.]